MTYPRLQKDFRRVLAQSNIVASGEATDQTQAKLSLDNVLKLQ